MLNLVHFGPSAAWPLKLVDFEKSLVDIVFCRIQCAWTIVLLFYLGLS